LVWTASFPGYSICSKSVYSASEATDELRHYHDRLDLDPNRLFELEQRISRKLPGAETPNHARRAS
jgi:hypothetical protein